MLLFSPRIFKGETIYSWLTRWALYSGMPTQKVALSHILGKRTGYQLMSQFPSYIPQLSLCSNIQASSLVYEHTTIPYYRVFSDPQRYNQAVQALAKGESQNLFRKLSITANRIPDSANLKYCPQCSFHDYKTLGTTFWHIEHQLPGVTACRTHNSKLMSYKKGRNKLILPPSSTTQPDLTLATETAVRLSKLSCELLNDSLSNISINALQNGYKQRLVELAFATSESSIKQRKLREKLEGYWHNIIDEPSISSIFTLGSTHKYPSCIFQGYATQRHPLKHLLLIGCLFESVNECLNYCHQTNDMFLIPPQKPDTNLTLDQTVQRDFDNSVLTFLQEGRSLRATAKIVGANIAVIKAIAARNQIDIHRRTKTIFAQQRRTMWRQLVIGISTREIAITHHCSEGAVQKELTCYPELIELRKRIRFYKKRTEHREKILSLLDSINMPTRSLLQNRARSSYTWLFKHDKQWLYENLPQSIPRKMRPPNAK